MPLYGYRCRCGFEWETFYKTLPSERLQKGAPCPECGKLAVKLLPESFSVNGTQQGGIQKEAAFAAGTADIGGRLLPVAKDENGKTVEIKSASDMDRWMGHNQLGLPRMTEWRNPLTGKKSWVPKRSVMRADPVSGEPLDLGIVERESERLVKLNDQRGEFVPPSESKTGRKIDPKTGVLEVSDPSKVKSRIIDPETHKPVTLADLWGGGGGVPENGVR